VLCAHGADANAFWTNQADGVNESALYAAVQASCIEAANSLPEAGANRNDGESLYPPARTASLNCSMRSRLSAFTFEDDDDEPQFDLAATRWSVAEGLFGTW
jgi:hypothetical protein